MKTGFAILLHLAVAIIWISFALLTRDLQGAAACCLCWIMSAYLVHLGLEAPKDQDIKP